MTEYFYIDSATSLLEKIARYDAIIKALEDQMLLSSEDAGYEEYSIDDGQVKIKSMFRDPLSISSAILKFEQARGRAIHKLNGANVVMRGPRQLRTGWV